MGSGTRQVKVDNASRQTQLSEQPIEAVFEHGVLRPLEPLALEDEQHVLITIRGVATHQTPYPRAAELEWLRQHRAEYRGQWVALDGDVLLSHGPKAGPVLEEACRKGVPQPLLTRVPDDIDLPSGGWL